MSPSRKRLALVAAIMGSFVAGLDATVVNVALPAIGRDLGGGLIDVASWRWIFAINVPFVLATLALVAAAVPPSPGKPGVHLDWLGALLTVLGLAGPVLALIRQPAVGWGSPEVWAVGLGGLGLLAAFVGHEARTPHPMLPLGLFRRRDFAAGNV